MTQDTVDPERGPSPAVRARLRMRSTRDTVERRRRMIIWGLAVALCVLLVNSLVGEYGYLATVRAAREENALRSELAGLRLENEHLQQQSDRLLHDPSALEEEARRSLSLVRPGETLVIIRDMSPAAPPPQ